MGNYPLEIIDNSNTRLLLTAANTLGIEWIMIDDDRYQVLFIKDGQAHLQQAHSFRLNSSDSIQLTKDKYRTYSLLHQAGIPVLPKIVIQSKKEYHDKGKSIPFPHVIKPIDGEKGEGVFLNIPNSTSALAAIDLALPHYPQLVVEPYFPGKDIRMLCLNHHVIGVSERKPPAVTGDGEQTIAQLIDQENIRRLKLNTKAGIRMLNQIRDLDRIIWYLHKVNLTLETILPSGHTQLLHDIPNYSAGGSVKTVEQEHLHPSFVTLAQQTSQVTGLTIVGIDLLIKDLKKPATQDNCVVVEVNSDPGLRLHDLPNEGKPQKVCEKLLQYVFDVVYNY